MKVLYKIILVGATGVLFSTSCQSSPKVESKPAVNNRIENTKPEPVKENNSSINTDAAPAENSETETFTKLFSGSIGDDNGDEKPKIPPFQMRLKRNGSELSGVYRYKNSNKDINLNGKIDDDDKFILTESIGGKETGKFDGSLESNGEGLLKMNGVWSKPNSDDYLGFSADEIPVEMSGANVYVDDKSLTEKNNRFDISINYPQITGAASPNVGKLNLALKNIALQYQQDFKKGKSSGDEAFSTEMSYTIHFADDNLFSIEFAGESNTGGAHPNHNTKTLNFNMKTGKPIQLAELFKPDSKYLEKLASISLAKIKEDLGDGIFEDGIKPLAKNYQIWAIQKDGLLICFDEYQAAPYTSGRQDVLIDYADLKDLINPNGVLTAITKKEGNNP